MNRLIKPQKLNKGDTIGIIAPCIAIWPEYIKNSIATLESLGFKIKLSKNLFSNALGFAGTIEERADDFNEMISDSNIKMVFFGGGEVCNEILPYIDYENIKHNPKIICSYSDSTTILNAIYYKTGLVTFYGASPRTFDNLNDYNLACFTKRLMNSDLSYEKASEWTAVNGGVCIGKLIGGYLVNFAIMQNGDYFKTDKADKYILFIEDQEKFSSPAVVSKHFSHLEQSGIFENVTGLILGHYSCNDQPQITEILKRISDKYCIPIIKNDDFGHGKYNAITPIGVNAKLDAYNLKLEFLESGIV